MKSIAAKFLLVVGLLGVLFTLFDICVTYRAMRRRVMELVDRQAALALAFDLAIRNYVAEEIRPEMERRVGPGEFIPETMSTSFVARRIFEKVREQFPEYVLKFSSDNPRNPANQAGPDELRMIAYFNDHPEASTWSGTITIDGQRHFALFSARRMEERCLRCHGRPQDAPASLVARYGPVAGFERPVGQVIALDTVAIPMERIEAAMAAQLGSTLAVRVLGLAVLIGGVLVVFRLMVGARLAAIAGHFRELATRPAGVTIRPLAVRSRDEIGALAASFNALAEKLRAAYASLEQRVAERTEELTRTNHALRREIAERRQVEQALRESEERHRRLFEEARDAIFLADPESGLIVDCNRAATELVGKNKSDLVGQHQRTLHPPDEIKGEFSEAFRRHLKDAEGKVLECRVVTATGETSDVAIKANLVEIGGRKLLQGVFRDISDRKRAEAALAGAHRAKAEEARKLRSMIEGMDEGVVVANADDVITEVNTWFLERVGLRREEIVGRCLWEFHPDTPGTARLRTVMEAFRSGARRDTHVVNRERLGMQVSLRVQPIFEGERYQGVILNVIDVTDLVEARRAAEEATRVKSAFLANMSHEIRTPMTAILGFAEVIYDSVVCCTRCEGRLDCTQRAAVHDAIDTIKRNGDYLLRIINDILDLSKIEAGKLTLERLSCSPARVLAEVASLARVRAEAKRLPFQVEYAGPIPETIRTDPTRLKQILLNLISNALKFTQTGSVRLVARFVDAGPEPLMEFDVVDTGIGMTAEEAARIFEPFSQADGSTTRRFGGTGLGLSISKRLAEMLGGELRVVETSPGAGTCMRLTLPTGPLAGVRMLADPQSATAVSSAAQGTPPPAEQAALNGVRILLAEDGPDNQRLIAYVLRKAGAEVAIAENGELAVEAALAAQEQGRPFDVVLMDMQMPVMDGYAATRLLRRRKYAGRIVALTAHAMAGDREKCLEAGCDEYASKPIDRHKLIATIAAQLGRGLQPARDGRAG